MHGHVCWQCAHPDVRPHAGQRSQHGAVGHGSEEIKHLAIILPAAMSIACVAVIGKKVRRKCFDGDDSDLISE